MKSFFPLFAITAVSISLHAADPIELKLWPTGAPEPEGFTPEQEKVIPPKDEKDVKRVTNVMDPTITVFKPEKPNGTAVIVCPGGAYRILAIEHEGTRACEYLNSLGVTAVLLKYRVPARSKETPGKEPLQDAQRAIGLVRHHAAAWWLSGTRACKQ